MDESARFGMKGLSSTLSAYMKSVEDETVVRNSRLHQAWERIAPSQMILDHSAAIIYSKKGREGVDTSHIIIYLDDNILVTECDMGRESYRALFQIELGHQVDEVRFKKSRYKNDRHVFKKSGFSFRNTLDEFTGQRKDVDVTTGKTLPYIEEVETCPLTEKEKGTVVRKTRHIENEKLRTSVSEAMKANMEWKKSKPIDNGRQNRPQGVL